MNENDQEAVAEAAAIHACAAALGPLSVKTRTSVVYWLLDKFELEEDEPEGEETEEEESTPDEAEEPEPEPEDEKEPPEDAALEELPEEPEPDPEPPPARGARAYALLPESERLKRAVQRVRMGGTVGTAARSFDLTVDQVQTAIEAEKKAKAPATPVPESSPSTPLTGDALTKAVLKVLRDKGRTKINVVAETFFKKDEKKAYNFMRALQQQKLADVDGGAGGVVVWFATARGLMLIEKDFTRPVSLSGSSSA